MLRQPPQQAVVGHGPLVLNEGIEPVAGNMRVVDTATLGTSGVAGATEQVSGAALPTSTELPLELEPQGLAVIEIALRQ